MEIETKDPAVLPELKDVTFHRTTVLKRPKPEHMLGMDDTDEAKLPAINKLLHKIFQFHSEMQSVNIPLQSGEYDYYKRKNFYKMVDTEYEDFEPFQIHIKSSHFNPKDRFSALHAGFNFFLYVNQDGYRGRGEIADWIKIHLTHLNTTPFSFASSREHVKALTHWPGKHLKYFEDIPMKYTTTVSFDCLEDGLSFKTDLFNQSVDDACIVMDKIISRKKFLKLVPEKEYGTK